MSIINNERLCFLVKERPGLWDKTCSTYKDRLATKNAWSEVARKLGGKNGDESFQKEVMRRWTNMRDAFVKSLRDFQKKKRSGSEAVILKKYIYNDQMQFLKKLYAFEETESNLDEEEENSKHSIKFIESSMEPMTSSQSQSQQPNQFFLPIQSPEPESSQSTIFNQTLQLNSSPQPIQCSQLRYPKDPLQFIQSPQSQSSRSSQSPYSFYSPQSCQCFPEIITQPPKKKTKITNRTQIDPLEERQESSRMKCLIGLQPYIESLTEMNFLEFNTEIVKTLTNLYKKQQQEQQAGSSSQE